MTPSIYKFQTEDGSRWSINETAMVAIRKTDFARYSWSIRSIVWVPSTESPGTGRYDFVTSEDERVTTGRIVGPVTLS